MQSKGVPARKNDGGIVGTIKDGTLYKSALASRHFLHSPPGIALDVTTVEQAQNLSTTRISITDKEGSGTYTCSMTTFIEHSERSEEHTSELQSHSFISYAVFCLKKKIHPLRLSTVLVSYLSFRFLHLPAISL